MYLSALTALDRKNGKLIVLASVAYAAAGRDCAKVAIAYQELMSGTPAAAAKRAKYSHLLFMVDNQVRNQHYFPDPAIAAEKAGRLEKRTAEVRLRDAQTGLSIAAKAKEDADAQLAVAQAHAASLGISVEAAKPAAAAITPTVVAPPTPVITAPDIGALRAEAERLDAIAAAASAAASAAVGKPEEEDLIKAAIEADGAAQAAKAALDAAAQNNASK